jgi:predicted DCC family thiol-disulfide oxidoreductase YuxK
MPTHTIHLIYDGECFFCRHTAQALKLRQAAGELELINARNSHPLVSQAKQQGYDLNEGILVFYADNIFYGPDAVQFLALLSSSADWFNRLNARFFRYKATTQLLYPFFKALRKALLKFRGVAKIKPMADE